MQIEITDDFTLSRIADSGQCFRVKCLDNGAYRFITGRHILHISPIAGHRYEVDCTLPEWRDIWFPYFDLGRDYERLRSRVPDTDPYMKNAADYGAGLRILRQDPWEMLVTFIISQQKTIPSISSSVEKIAQLYGEAVGTAHGTVHLFPTAEQMRHAASKELGQCRLGYRTPYILDAISRVSSSELDLNALYGYDDTALLDALKSVHGVGDKVANCVALFAYGRTALVPVDTWIKKVIDGVYHGHNPFLRYGGVAGIMQQYIFYYAQQHKGEFPAHAG